MLSWALSTCALSIRKRPASQFWQSVEASCPSSSLYLPAAQIEQSVSSSKPVSFDEPTAEELPPPVLELYLPIAQIWQSVSETDPTTSENVPAGQILQSEEEECDDADVVMSALV